MTAAQENYIRTSFKWPFSWEVIVKRLVRICCERRFRLLKLNKILQVDVLGFMY